MMVKEVLILLLCLGTLCCQLESKPLLNNNSNGTSRLEEAITNSSVGDSVKIEMKEQNRMEAVFILKNLSSQKIYLFFEPSDNDEEARFISYILEKRDSSDNDFHRYNVMSHIILDVMTPLLPNSNIYIRLRKSDFEKGEYRVGLQYWGNEKIYNLYKEKGLRNMTDDELIYLRQTAKTVFSDVFFVPRNHG